MQSLEINSCMYGQLIHDKGAKKIQWKMTVASINGTEKTEQTVAEE